MAISHRRGPERPNELQRRVQGADIAPFVFMAMVLVFPVRMLHAEMVNVPKTGQTASQLPGDDGFHAAGLAWPDPRFQDNGDGTVTDNLTGLMWTKDASLSGQGGLAQGFVFIGLMNDGTFENFGYTDWRMPNINELMSLHHFGVADSAAWLNDVAFDKVPSSGPSCFLSSTHLGGMVVYGWPVWSFVLGTDVCGMDGWVWPVRGHTSGPARVLMTGQKYDYWKYIGDDADLMEGVRPGTNPRLRTIACQDKQPGKDDNVLNDVVFDTATGLIYPRNFSLLPGIDWVDGVGAASAIELCGWKGWRMPNLRELLTLVDWSFGYLGQHFGALVGTGQPNFLNIPGEFYLWSSTVHPASVSSAYVLYSWDGKKEPGDWTPTTRILTRQRDMGLNDTDLPRMLVLPVLALPPQPEVSPADLSFGIVSVGWTGGPKQLKLKAVGSVPVWYQPPRFGGPHQADFTLGKGSDDVALVGGLAVPVETELKIEVVFAPQAAGARNATLIVPYVNPLTATEDRIEIPLSGTGLAGDSDQDGQPDVMDNCPLDSNAAQADADLDGFGDPCDPCPLENANTCATVSEMVDDPDLVGGVGGQSLCTDAQGSAHVFYAGDRVVERWRTAGGWQRIVVEDRQTTVAQVASAGGSDGSVHCAYVTSEGLRHGQRLPGSKWAVETVAQDVFALPPSMGLGSDNTVSVLFHKGTGGVQIWLSSRTPGGTWQTEMVAPDADAGQRSSLALAPDGTAHVAYCKGGALLHAFRNAPDPWSVETAVPAPANGMACKGNSIVVGPGGTVLLAAADTGSGVVTLATRSADGIWSTETFPTGQQTALAVGPDGTTHLGVSGKPYQYRIRLPGQAWIQEPVGTDKNSDGSLAAGSSGAVELALSTVDGISWWNRSAEGKWSQELVVEQGHDVGDFSAIDIDAKGGLHVAYRDATARAARYAHTSHPGGEWTIETIDGAGDTGYYCAVAGNADGTAAVLYMDQTDPKDWRLKGAVRDGSGAWTSDDLGHAAGPGSSLPTYGWHADVLSGSGGQYHMCVTRSPDAGYPVVEHGLWTPGAGWKLDTIEVDTLDPGCAMVVSGGDKVHIVYYNWDKKKIRLASRQNDGTWKKSEVSSAATMIWPSLTQDALGGLHLAYNDEAHPDKVMYLHKPPNGDWTQQILPVGEGDDAWAQKAPIALSVDSLLRRRLSYRATSVPDLTQLIQAGGGAWLKLKIGKNSPSGHVGSAADAFGDVHLVYREPQRKGLLHARVMLAPSLAVGTAKEQPVLISTPAGASEVNALALSMDGLLAADTGLLRLMFSITGSGDDSKAVKRLRLYTDPDGNGKVDAGEPLLADVASPFVADDGSLTVQLAAPFVVPAGANAGLVATLDFDKGPAPGDSIARNVRPRCPGGERADRLVVALLRNQDPGSAGLPMRESLLLAIALVAAGAAIGRGPRSRPFRWKELGALCLVAIVFSCGGSGGRATPDVADPVAVPDGHDASAGESYVPDAAMDLPEAMADADLADVQVLDAHEDSVPDVAPVDSEAEFADEGMDVTEEPAVDTANDTVLDLDMGQETVSPPASRTFQLSLTAIEAVRTDLQTAVAIKGLPVSGPVIVVAP